jgi:hypothetical protein
MGMHLKRTWIMQEKCGGGGGSVLLFKEGLSLEGKWSGSGDGIYSKGSNMQRKVQCDMLNG